MKTMQFRQGDVFVECVDAVDVSGWTEVVPDAQGRIVLAYGEVTGHSHAISVPSLHDGLMAAQLLESPDKLSRILRVRGAEPVRLYHEEHGEIVFPPGDYEISIQREYTPGAIRAVLD